MQAEQMQQPSQQLPGQVTYSGQMVDAPRAYRKTNQFLSENSSVFSASNNIIRIPVSSASFLDLSKAVLQFTLKNSDTGAAIVDGGASNVISRIRIVGQNGQEIERIDGYNLLAVVLDIYGHSHGRATLDDALKGSATPAFAYAQGGADSLATTASKTYCQSLYGAWFNPVGDKLLPPRVQFTVELTLGSFNSCWSSATATGVGAYELTSVSLNIPMVTVEAVGFQDAVMQRMASRGIELYGQTYMQYISSLAASTGTENLMINARALSLDGLIMVPRTQSRLSTQNSLKLSTFTISTLGSYQVQIGSQQFPSNPVAITSTNTSGAYSETMRFFGSLNRSNPVGIVDVVAYGAAESTTYSGTGGAGLLAVDLRSYSNQNAMCGINTADSSLPVVLVINKTTGSAIFQLDTFAVMSCRFILSANGDVLAQK
jgi:hypothetical protein